MSISSNEPSIAHVTGKFSALTRSNLPLIDGEDRHLTNIDIADLTDSAENAMKPVTTGHERI